MTLEEISALRAAIARKVDVSDNGEWTILCTGCGAHVGLEGPAEADHTPSYCTSCAYEYLDKALEAFKALEAVIELREGALGAMTQGADALAVQVRLLNDRLAEQNRIHAEAIRGCNDGAVILAAERRQAEQQAELEKARADRAEAKLAAIREQHGTPDDCAKQQHDDPCLLCGILDCPLNEPGHYWKDGCPACVIEQLKREGRKL